MLVVSTANIAVRVALCNVFSPLSSGWRGMQIAPKNAFAGPVWQGAVVLTVIASPRGHVGIR